MMLVLYFISAFAISGAVFCLRNRVIQQLLILLFLTGQTLLTVYAFCHLNEKDSVYFAFDSIGIILSGILALLGYATFYHSYLYLERHSDTKRYKSVYYAALIMLSTAMNGAYFSEHLGTFWASVEATTLCVSVLVYHERTAFALEATWKYVFICSIGLSLALVGILSVSVAASNEGLTNLFLSSIVAHAQGMNTKWIEIAFILVLTGFSAKMGLFPLYAVCVDAHTTAPPPISAFISTTLMNVGFLGIYRMYCIIAQTDSLPWAKNVLWIAGIISISVSAVQLLRVKHFKRMFAFSSMEHMGIVALALSAGGIGYYAAILHITLHSFAKAGLFYQIGQVYSVYNSYLIKKCGNYIKLNPLGAIVVILAFICITAIPPSGLFVSEFMAFKSLFAGNHYYIAIAALFLLTVIIFVIGKNLLRLLYYNGKELITPQSVKVNTLETVSQFVLFGLIIYLGVNPPEFFSDLIKGATAVLH
ncbi:MAG: proton-conducting transporter membrane subunit [Candidatus Scalindua sp.]